LLPALGACRCRKTRRGWRNSGSPFCKKDCRKRCTPHPGAPITRRAVQLFFLKMHYKHTVCVTRVARHGFFDVGVPRAEVDAQRWVVGGGKSSEAGRQGDRETRRQGDRETRRQGDRETRDRETGRQGTGRLGDAEVREGENGRKGEGEVARQG